MEKFISQRFLNEKPSEISKIAEKSKKYDDIINLSIGDIDLITDRKIIDGMYQDTLNGGTHYSNPLGIEELRKEIIKCNKEDYDLDVNLDEVFVSSSATHATYLILKAILNPGDEVIVFGPYFISYKKQVELNYGKVVEVKTTKEDDFQIDFAILEKSITNKTKAIIINTPCNPTGKCYTKNTLIELNRIIKKYNLLLISDEIYTIFSYNEKFIPFLNIDHNLDNVVTIRSSSKDFAMTGFRLGYVIANPKFIKVLNQINEGVMYTAPTPSQNAYLHALRMRKEIYPIVYNEFKSRGDYAYERLSKINFLDPIKPDGTIYLWIDIQKTNLSSLEFAEWFLERYHILVLPGSVFGESGEGFARIALTVGLDKLKEAFDRLEEKNA